MSRRVIFLAALLALLPAREGQAMSCADLLVVPSRALWRTYLFLASLGGRFAETSLQRDAAARARRYGRLAEDETLRRALRRDEAELEETRALFRASTRAPERVERTVLERILEYRIADLEWRRAEYLAARALELSVAEEAALRLWLLTHPPGSAVDAPEHRRRLLRLQGRREGTDAAWAEADRRSRRRECAEQRLRELAWAGRSAEDTIERCAGAVSVLHPELHGAEEREREERELDGPHERGVDRWEWRWAAFRPPAR